MNSFEEETQALRQRDGVVQEIHQRTGGEVRVYGVTSSGPGLTTFHLVDSTGKRFTLIAAINQPVAQVAMTALSLWKDYAEEVVHETD